MTQDALPREQTASTPAVPPRPVRRVPARRLDVLHFIASFIDSNGYPPTIREIGTGCTILSTSVVNYHLDKLVAGGSVERDDFTSRGLRVTDLGWAQLGIAVPGAECGCLVSAVRAAVEAGEILPAGVLAAYRAVA
ncbi:MAG: hypothetical protein IT341_06845 [Chloroflexi bacterium]|nr:hypothetical protein [Chloroflexota bacterium]